MGIKIPNDAYCDITAVYQLLPSRKFDAETTPTLEQAEQHIKDVARKINSILLALGYPTVPFTGADDKKQLADLNKLGAAWRIEAAAQAGTEGENPVIKLYKDEYDADIEKLEKGGFIFVDAGSPPGSDVEGPSEDAEGGEREPIFSMDKSFRENEF